MMAERERRSNTIYSAPGLEVTGPYQTYESRMLWPQALRTWAAAQAQAPGARSYFGGGPMPPPDDRSAWDEIHRLNEQMIQFQQRHNPNMQGRPRDNVVQEILSSPWGRGPDL